MGFSGVHFWMSMEVAFMATVFMLVINHVEKKGDGPYPSIAFMAVGFLYLYYIFTAFFLWVFPYVGMDFRERFGYGYEYYLTAMWIGLASMGFTYLGYRLCYRTMEQPLGRFQKLEDFLLVNRNRVFFAAILFFACHVVIGIIRQKLELVTGYGSGNVYENQKDRTGNLFNLAYDLSTFAFPMILYIAYVSKKRWMFAVVVVLFGIEIATSLLAGGVLALFGALIPIIVLFLYKPLIPYREGPFRKIKIFRLTGIAMVGLFIAILAKNIVRSYVNLGFKANLFSVISNFPVFLSVFDPSIAIEHFVMGFVKEVSGADIISLIYHRMHEGVQHFRFGETYSFILTGFVPRLFWPGKPEITQSTWYVDNYWFTQEEVLKLGTGVQGNNFLLPGEAVMNFSFYAIPFEMLIYGCLIGLISKYLLQPRQMYFIGYILVCRLFFDLIHPATTFAALISNCLKQIILVFFTLIVLKYAIMILNASLRIIRPSHPENR